MSIILTGSRPRRGRRARQHASDIAEEGCIAMSVETVARPKEFAHMLLKVSDIKRSERFYIDLLGFETRKARPLPDGRPFVPFKQGLALTDGGPREPQQIDHIAFKAGDVRAIAERLKKADVKFYRDLHRSEE